MDVSEKDNILLGLVSKSTGVLYPISSMSHRIGVFRRPPFTSVLCDIGAGLDHPHLSHVHNDISLNIKVTPLLLTLTAAPKLENGRVEKSPQTVMTSTVWNSLSFIDGTFMDVEHCS